MAHHVWQPDEIVGNSGAHPAAERRMPPMLDIALWELAGGRSENVLPCEPGGRDDERHHVLKLVAEPEGAAGLVETAPRPETARQRLVEKPTIQHHVHRFVGRADLDCSKRVVPRSGDLAQKRVQIRGTISLDER